VKVSFLKLDTVGGFGTVRLASLANAKNLSVEAQSQRSTEDEDREDEQGRIFAVKVISKHKVIDSQQQDHMWQEIKYMNAVKHPFVLELQGIQQDTRNIYMLIDFVQNGELLKVINQFGKLNGACTRFYVAQVFKTFEYLHSKHLVYRDLKPENVLVGNDGFIKLTDFGFVKRLMPSERTYTLCGTPEYMAPEVV
jgi:protein kinase A